LNTSVLRDELYAHLTNIGAGKNPGLVHRTKEMYRAAHLHQRSQKQTQDQEFLLYAKEKYAHLFANGYEVKPDRLDVSVELVKPGTWQAELFRLVTHFWSVPVSRGFGRRLRFLVWDSSNEKLVGLFALGDAVFNLRIRDEFIGWDASQRKKRLVSLMDAYVVGAIPPYNSLLCGKLVAALIKSREVTEAFRDRYRHSVGVISGEKKNPYLAAVTVTSALGRSSIYNRLKLGDDLIFRGLGYTEGWGHFHIPEELFEKITCLLKSKRNGNVEAYNFGQGPNWRFRMLRDGLKLLGMEPGLLNHGYRREVFFSGVADNHMEILNEKQKRARYEGVKSVSELSAIAVERWVRPRSISRPDYRTQVKETFLRALSGYV